MEIDVRAVYTFRSIGVGHVPLSMLCGFLNMPPSLTKNEYDGLSYSIMVAPKQVLEKSMSNAAARSMDYITLLFKEIVTARHILLSELYMVQLNLLRNMSVTMKKYRFEAS